MKKICTLLFIAFLLIPLFTQAQNKATTYPLRIYTFVGTVTAIDQDEKSFDIKLGGLAQGIKGFFAALFSFGKVTSPIYKVVTDENTTFSKKTTSGVVNGSFGDLKTGLRVQVKGGLTSSTNTQYRGVIQAKSVFILTPTFVTPPSIAPECSNDNDCAWCGNNCLPKSRIPIGGKCPDVIPPANAQCKCQNGKCQKIIQSLISTSSPAVDSTTSTGDSSIPDTQAGQIQCIPMCYISGGQARGWAWRCLNPETGDWEWHLNYKGSVDLIKIDKFCKNCGAKCLYQGTPEEGYYSTCTNKLIVSGCTPPFIKPTKTF